MNRFFYWLADKNERWPWLVLPTFLALWAARTEKKNDRPEECQVE